MTEAGSLRGRLLRGLAALLAVLLLVSGWSSYGNGRAAADAAYDRTLLVSARAIAERLMVADGRLGVDVPLVALDSFDNNRTDIYSGVIDFQGGLVVGYDLPAAPPNTKFTDDYPALARFYDGQYQDQGVRVVSLQYPVSEPELKGMAEIRVAETQGSREGMARGLLTDTLWRLGLLAIGALLLVWLAVSVALRPLGRLSEAVEKRQPDDLRPLPLVSVQRELKPLVGALNHFTERLRAQFERQAQFIADAAHELRTPLAALKLRLDRGLGKQEPAAWRSTLEEAAQDTDKLTHLANEFLTQARIENAARAIREGGAARIDLSQLARELGMALAPLAHARAVVLALEAEQPVWLRGDPTLLNELLCNLVDNAVAHTPAGGNVILRVLEPGVLEVEDDGPGIPTQEREKVFARFHRSPRGRGAGLGLAIVGEICRVHLATISLHTGAVGGLRVRVEFPVEGARGDQLALATVFRVAGGERKVSPVT